MIFEKTISRWAEHVRVGCNIPLRVVLWNGEQFDLGTQDPRVTVRVNSATALQYLMKPNLGILGEGYVEGKLDLEGNLSDIIDVAYSLADNAAQKTRTRDAQPYPLRRFTHTREAEEVMPSRHDVSNDFYRLWLDENMVYSCAYFENGDEDLGTAQLKEIDRILRKIQVQPGQRLLDIGCGWGALVLRAAQKFGAQCVGITLSQDQFDLATERVKAAGLSDRIEIRLQDYRDVEGPFDRITSVGVFEHIGRENPTEYFQKIRDLLTDDGIVMIDGITPTDPDHAPRAVSGSALLSNRYVFPGLALPHAGLVVRTMQKAGLETLHIENLRPDCLRTLNLWIENFEAKADELRKHIDDRRFREWRVYLAGLTHAFEIGDVSAYQIVCLKSGKRPADLPLPSDDER